MPGLPVSSRTPRSKMRTRSSSGMPVPSSSTRISTNPACARDRHEHAAAAVFGGVLDQIAEHLVQVLPLDMRPAGPSARPCRCGRGGRAAPTARSTDSTLGHTSARLCAEPRRPTARARARWWSTCRRIVRASRTTVSARSSACAVAAFMMTVSGVLSACARLPAWRRASSACALVVRDQRVQFLDHRRDLDRHRRRHAVRSARRASARSPRAPGAAATARRRSAAPRARSAPAPAARRLRTSVRRSAAICASSPSRLCATWKRQRTGDPGSVTSRSTTRSFSSANCVLS